MFVVVLFDAARYFRCAGVVVVAILAATRIDSQLPCPSGFGRLFLFQHGRVLRRASLTTTAGGLPEKHALHLFPSRRTLFLLSRASLRVLWFLALGFFFFFTAANVPAFLVPLLYFLFLYSFCFFTFVSVHRS